MTLEVKARREAMQQAKEDDYLNEIDAKQDRIENMNKLKGNKVSFNSTSVRKDEVASSELPQLGPGSYNPINKTIMEGYIKQKLIQEKKETAHENDWRVFNRVIVPKEIHSEGNYYDLPGAFDHTLKKAKKAHFISKQIQYPSSFGTSTKRF
jgi:hypothetical protein